MSEGSLLRSIALENNIKFTENGATALRSTSNPLIDLFGVIGASRDNQDIITTFIRSYAEDPLLTLKMVFYARDVRGGLGEREIPRILFNYLATNHTSSMKANLHLIPEYGRWDDMLAFINTPLQDDAIRIISRQLTTDLGNLRSGNQHVSLLGKWLPSENASSLTTRRLASIVRTALGYSSSKQYRKDLTALRSAIKIVESDMSSKNWSAINYSTVPSVAAHKYTKAFTRNDFDRYSQFIHDVAAGKTTINSSTLYPYDLVRSYLKSSNHYDGIVDPTIEEQWKALPNFVTNPSVNFLVMADVSGSMESPNYTPIATSIGLAIYFAEHNSGAFANNFITFTDEPRLVSLPSNLSLLEKVRLVEDHVGYDTNLEAAFELVLRAAIHGHVPQEELPTAIVVISDMEINSFGAHYDDDINQAISFTDAMAARYDFAGYKMPTLVYWNVAARQNTFHATTSDNVRFVSGSSPSIFAGLCEHLGSSPEELMMAILNSPRYAAVTLPTTDQI